MKAVSRSKVPQEGNAPSLMSDSYVQCFSTFQLFMPVALFTDFLRHKALTREGGVGLVNEFSSAGSHRTPAFTGGICYAGLTVGGLMIIIS